MCCQRGPEERGQAAEGFWSHVGQASRLEVELAGRGGGPETTCGDPDMEELHWILRCWVVNGFENNSVFLHCIKMFLVLSDCYFVTLWSTFQIIKGVGLKGCSLVGTTPPSHTG